MLSKPLAVALVALACVSAGAGGAYVAMRQTASPGSISAEPHEAAAAQPEGAPSAVHETEALVGQVQEPVELARPEPERPVRTPARRVAAPEPAPQARPQARPQAAPPSPPAVTTAQAGSGAAPAQEPVEVPRPAAAEGVRRDPLPPMRTFEDLVIPAAAVVGLQVETPVSSERARIEDRVEARVLRDITVEGRTAVAAGAKAIGAVTLVDRGGKLKERAQLGVRFHTLVLADGTYLPIQTESVLREGESPTGESARKIGGAAAGGAILGAILGGKKGAIVGGATGAAGGTAVVVAGDRNPATLPVGAVITVRLSAPLAVEVEKR